MQEFEATNQKRYKFSASVFPFEGRGSFTLKFSLEISYNKTKSRKWESAVQLMHKLK